MSCSVVNMALAMDPTVEELQEKILDSRIRFDQGHIVFAVSEEDLLSDQTSKKNLQTNFDIFFSEARLSVKVKVAVFQQGRHLEMKEYRILDDNIILYKPSAERFSVSVDERTKSPRLARNDLFDPRMLGIALSKVSVFDAVGLREAAQLKQRIDSRASVTLSPLNGVEAWLVEDTLKTENGTISLHTWVVPSMGYIVPKRERVYSNANKNGKMSIETEYKEYEQGYFPSQSIFVHEINGKVVNREKVIVEEGVFSEGVNPAEFRIEALNLKPGRHVENFGEKMVWNGETLVPDPVWQSQRDYIPISISEQSWTRQIILAINAILCFALAVFLLIRRRSKANSGM